MELKNRTPFLLRQTVVLDKTAREVLIVAVKATYEMSSRGLKRADEQRPPAGADLFHGDPTETSIRQESEMEPPRRTTDLFLTGSAKPSRTGVRMTRVRLRVGTVKKEVAVFGRRVWFRRLGVVRISEPEPLDEVPLTYENAFGGRDCSSSNPRHHDEEARNPVGRGFFSSPERAAWEDQPLPQIENPRDLLRTLGQRVRPEGFGPICRHWEPRRRYAGTYDQAWQEERMPLLPLDFDERFHSAAHPDLVTPAPLQGDEPVEVLGCTRDGPLRFDLPGDRPEARIQLAGRWVPVELGLDSVTLDCGAMELRLLWKGQTPVHRQLLRLRRTECWLRGGTA